MNKLSNWDVTVQTKSTEIGAPTSSNHGCIVKIHPMDLENKLFRLNQPQTTIGRAPECDLFCDDPSISRQHAVITKSANGFFIEDLDSTNGTYVDSCQVNKSKLEDNVQIRVGNHIFKFIADDSIESQYHETVYNMMTKDGLTGVYNKRYLVETLEREFDRSRFYNRPFSILMMDIDHFKNFNDTYGHLAGDEVLREFATRVEQACQPGQILARFGGEEFAILLSETGLEEASAFAERIRQVIADNRFHSNAGQLTVTTSIGVAEVNLKMHASFSDLLEQADRHLYAAKQNGRNQTISGE